MPHNYCALKRCELHEELCSNWNGGASKKEKEDTLTPVTVTIQWRILGSVVVWLQILLYVVGILCAFLRFCPNFNASAFLFHLGLKIFGPAHRRGPCNNCLVAYLYVCCNACIFFFTFKACYCIACQLIKEQHC